MIYTSHKPICYSQCCWKAMRIIPTVYMITSSDREEKGGGGSLRHWSKTEKGVQIIATKLTYVLFYSTALQLVYVLLYFISFELYSVLFYCNKTVLFSIVLYCSCTRLYFILLYSIAMELVYLFYSIKPIFCCSLLQ